jgi:hypothetical protein
MCNGLHETKKKKRACVSHFEKSPNSAKIQKKTLGKAASSALWLKIVSFEPHARRKCPVVTLNRCRCRHEVLVNKSSLVFADYSSLAFAD